MQEFVLEHEISFVLKYPLTDQFFTTTHVTEQKEIFSLSINLKHAHYSFNNHEYAEHAKMQRSQICKRVKVTA
jgi:hypothetical protein